MPAILINSLRVSALPSVLPVFSWDGADDAGLLAFIAANKNTDWAQDHAVDRTGPTPVLRWQKYAYGSPSYTPTGIWGSLNLVVDEWIQASNFSSGWGPMVWPTLHYWVCDEHGRAFTIDDLVVP